MSNSNRTARLVEQELGRTGVGAGDVWLVESREDLAGIALSGGGIRSATFNLGLLQGLEKLGLLGAFDYLSTVSGGGYIGAFWKRWHSRKDRPPDQARRCFPARDDDDGEEPPPIRHLREFSNFLIPRLGLLTVDTGRALVAVLSSTIPALLAALSLLLLGTGAWLGAVYLLFGVQPVPPAGPDAWLMVSFFTILLGTALVLPIGEQMMPRSVREAYAGWYVLAASLATLATAGTWALIVQRAGWLNGGVDAKRAASPHPRRARRAPAVPVRSLRRLHGRGAGAGGPALGGVTVDAYPEGAGDP